MTIGICKQCAQMFHSTQVSQTPVVAAPQPKTVQTTDTAAKLRTHTLYGLHDDYWPGEKLMLKLEAATKGTSV